MAAGDDGERLFKITAQLLRGAGFARVIARHRQAAAEFLAGVLKATHVVPMPTVDGNGDARQLFEGFVGVHA